MAIETVTTANLADYAASRTKSGDITNAEQVTAEVQKTGKETPVIATGTETVADAPDPGEQKREEKVGDTRPVQERINELTRLRKEAEEFAEDEYNARLRAERRIGELEAELTKGKKVEEPIQEVELKRPSPKDFTDQDAFDAAMAAYDVKREEKLAARIRAEEAERSAMERQNEAMRVRVERAKKQIPDFTDVIESADRIKTIVPNHVQAAIIESEYGPEIAYHLAKNPEEQQRIFALTPARALLELGKIETKFIAAESKETKPPPTVETTRAPAPVTSITSADGVVNSDLSKPMSFADYKQQRMAERRKRGR